MDFDEAMHVKCSMCGRRAGWHRLTKRGALYCLKLNGAGVKRRNSMRYNGYHYDPATMHNIGVKYLERSPIPEEVVTIIAIGIGNYMEVGNGQEVLETGS